MATLKPGDNVGRYEIRAVIGEGGFGKVYRAWDAGLERRVAIKELSSERKARDPTEYAEYLERFRMERRVQGQFQHPHIVSVYDLVQQDGDEYLIEELVGGGTLRDLIQEKGRLSPERVIEIGVEMCQAIAAAWEQDIVHRDVKPSNILLTDEGRAKLTDFGVAQIGQMSQRTQSDSHHPGTPAYMSPEQEKGYGYLDDRSDLYALGLVLYEALTGRSYKRERVAARQLAPGVPKGLEKVVMRALEPEPADRYQRAAEFEEALRHARHGSRPLWRWIGGAIALLALIIGGTLLGLPPGGRGSSTPTATPTAAPTATSMSTSSPTPTPHTPTPTLTGTPTPTLMPSPTPTRVPVISAPQLISPPGASVTRSLYVTFKWEGELPDAGYGFRVTLHHQGNEHSSAVLEDTEWALDLPGGAGDAVGEWRWSVAIVRRGGTQDTVARSDEWTFYYDPFPDSPLATPTP